MCHLARSSIFRKKKFLSDLIAVAFELLFFDYLLFFLYLFLLIFYYYYYYVSVNSHRRSYLKKTFLARYLKFKLVVSVCIFIVLY